mmetsp:Transcript_6683/g.14627  ORF Transcript_6683/g.14627 Transcript_6683/m.14627 type:complete len:226 (+) Transcript_6683:157-834(+)
MALPDTAPRAADAPAPTTAPAGPATQKPPAPPTTRPPSDAFSVKPLTLPFEAIAMFFVAARPSVLISSTCSAEASKCSFCSSARAATRRYASPRTSASTASCANRLVSSALQISAQASGVHSHKACSCFDPFGSAPAALASAPYCSPSATRSSMRVNSRRCEPTVLTLAVVGGMLLDLLPPVAAALELGTAKPSSLCAGEIGVSAARRHAGKCAASASAAAAVHN